MGDHDNCKLSQKQYFSGEEGGVYGFCHESQGLASFVLKYYVVKGLKA